MVRDHINHYLRCGADSLPFFHGLIDQWLGFNVQAVRLFDDRLCLIEKIDQRPRPWQRFLNLLKLCFAETGRVPDEFNKSVFKHSLTLLVAAAIMHWLTTITPKRRHMLGFLRLSASRCHDQFRAWIQSSCGRNRLINIGRPIMSPRAGVAFIARPFGRNRHLDRPHTTTVHVEWSSGAVHDLLRDHNLLDALEAG